MIFLDGFELSGSDAGAGNAARQPTFATPLDLVFTHFWSAARLPDCAVSVFGDVNGAVGANRNADRPARCICKHLSSENVPSVGSKTVPDPKKRLLGSPQPPRPCR
jgi:hypothetical protein